MGLQWSTIFPDIAATLKSGYIKDVHTKSEAKYSKTPRKQQILTNWRNEYENTLLFDEIGVMELVESFLNHPLYLFLGVLMTSGPGPNCLPKEQAPTDLTGTQR